MINHIYREETILEAHKSTVRFEAKLIDVEHLIEPNRHGEYITKLMPLTASDHQVFCEAADSAIATVELKKDYYSRKVAKQQFETEDGFIIANQLFPPKLNLKLDFSDYLYQRDCSITGYFKDLDSGNIVFIISYLDLYDLSTKTSFQVEVESDLNAPVDFDF